ncbi:glycolate oxidase subunit GlcE [Paraburkholderia fungorum]|jgi:glycolate oxidase FAD binding subunit|uniref:Glycolate oxidase subunit GlcE n=1 Tax=Paraburkholderia fungorum TaxID=134537 RepID=A0AAP5QDL8_9BURK|nr:glycolate oxidase subunit GlcE [Paraburkholderia fungorum]MDT8841194.1 glycolate oxidase subunit GlcE [Paraburkholderia fungorum]PRZ53400.1 glycolate oxidase FAD binding subunit [Paraburkholderia fungorum]USX10588.1 glycolate oxidase subunit GlcE [Paraburkholderia fungorum]
MLIEPVSMDDSERLVAEISQARADGTPLKIRGGNSKAFLGRPVHGTPIDTRSHRGVLSYDPTELVITARAGTPVAELNAVLDAAGQMLPCEPPAFDGMATVGGMVAAGLAGPRRPWSGSVRDFVLGCRVITGEAKHLRFGGEVMKNVAGYDVSRLLAGSFGCLGLITEVSLKVLPKPRALGSLALDLSADEALRELSAWRRAALPISGAAHVDGRLHVRLEGGTGSVASALDRIGGSELDSRFWDDLREHRLAFFDDPRPLWRLSLPNAAPLVRLPGDTLLDWAGAQRWLKSDAPAVTIRQIAHAAGGHATCFTPRVDAEPFTPLPQALLRFHQQLKQQLDPRGLFNPGRLYAGL